jgi:DnaJ-domain-containing protein 1
VRIFDRLENLVKSYLNGEGTPFSESFEGRSSGDPDLDSAYEELNEFLNAGKSGGAGGFSGGNGRAGKGNNAAGDRTARSGSAGNAVPEELRGDFAELGVPFGAPVGECKAAYKQLLKKHHPDRHAGHAGNMRKATEKTARVNAAFDRIKRWRTTGRVD